ncbi:MAG: helix-turn-helix transcriptional regulator [Clostridia bacterium]|nr:helix-turn-helix transcriptional regulator [Clostridia bacterium]
MNLELTIPIGAQAHKVFLQGGFYQYNGKPAALHMHNYAEIHVITDGTMVYEAGDLRKTVESNSVLIIPPRCFHGCISMEETARHSAFQIDLPCAEFAVRKVSGEVLDTFFRLIDQAAAEHDYTELAAYISFLTAPFCRAEPIYAQRISDSGFLIHEFFVHHYSEDMHLSDLAEELHLSERQTERLVLEHTGRTFREELTRIRLLMADRLLKTTDLSLSEIARYVGYRSYAGFWKAIKKH